MPKDNLKLGGQLTIHKWNPEDLVEKTILEAVLVPQLAQSYLDDNAWVAVQNAKHPEWQTSDSVKDAATRYATVHAHEEAIRRMIARGRGPLESIEKVYNSLVNTGLTDYNTLLTGGGGTVYSNANALMGAGSSSAAVTTAQVDLQAATGAATRYIMSMDASYPTVSNGVLTFRATFATGNGNFSWQEIVISTTGNGAVGTAALTRILNRFLNAAGTKPSTQSWQVTVTMTLS